MASVTYTQNIWNKPHYRTAVGNATQINGFGISGAYTLEVQSITETSTDWKITALFTVNTDLKYYTDWTSATEAYIEISCAPTVDSNGYLPSNSSNSSRVIIASQKNASTTFSQNVSAVIPATSNQSVAKTISFPKSLYPTKPTTLYVAGYAYMYNYAGSTSYSYDYYNYNSSSRITYEGTIDLTGIQQKKIVTLTTTADTRIYRQTPDTNYGTLGTINVGGGSGAYSDRNEDSLVKFDISSIPSTANIVSAKLRTYISSAGTNGGSTNTGYTPYLVNTDWVESYPTYTNFANKYDSAVSSPSISVSLYSATNTQIIGDVTNIVKTWFASGGNRPNYGIYMKGFHTNTTDSTSSILFHSKEASNSAYFPKLDIEYEDIVPPQPPVLTYPNGGETIDNSVTITWTLPTNGDTFKYHVQYTTDNGINWIDLILLTDVGATSCVFDTSALAETSYARVRVRSNDPATGLYSGWDMSDATFTIFHAGSRPAVAITDPSVDVTTITTPTYIFKGSYTHDTVQQSFRWKLYKSIDLTQYIFDSGEISGNMNQIEITTLEDGVDYLIQFSAKSSNGYSSTASRSFSVRFPDPAQPTIDVTWERYFGYVRIVVQNNTSPVTKNTIYKRRIGTTTWKKVVDITPTTNPYEYFDYAFLKGNWEYAVDTTYGVRVSPKSIKAVNVFIIGQWIQDETDPSRNVHFLYEQGGIKSKLNQDTAEMKTYSDMPRVRQSAWKYYTGQLTAEYNDDDIDVGYGGYAFDQYNKLESLTICSYPLLLKLDDGRVYKVRLRNFDPTSSCFGTRVNVTVDWIQVDKFVEE